MVLLMFFYAPGIRREYFEPKVVKLLIIINVVVFVAEIVYEPLIYMFALFPYKILNGIDLWTIITHMFLHAGFLHIFLNMYALLIFGPECEKEFGHIKFLIIYILSGVSGAILHSLLTPFKYTPAVGASGAVFGIMAAYAVLYPRRRLMMFVFVGFLILPAWALLLFFFLMETLLGLVAYASGVAHLAHVGGMILGAAYTFFYKKRKVEEKAFILPSTIMYYETIEEESSYDYW